MALIQLNINRLGQGWFILWAEAVLGGSLGVYQAAEAPGRWTGGDGRWMRDSTRGLTLVPSDHRDGTSTGWALWGHPPCHLLARCRETGLKIGGLGLLGECERQAGTAHADTLGPVGNSLKSSRQAQLIPVSALRHGRITIKTPQFCPGVMGPSLAPGQSLPRAVEKGLVSPRILFPATQP